MVLREVWALSSVLIIASAIVPATQHNVYDHFADQTHSTRQYVCSEEERACFRDDKVIYEADSKCYKVGERGPCEPHQTFRVDKKELTRLGGHIRGTCDNGCEDATHAPLVTTGECMSKSEVEKKICRSNWYLRAAKDVFGQWVCEWTRLPCSPADRSQRFRNKYDFPYDGICSAPDIFTQSGAPEPTNNTKVVDGELSDHPLLIYFSKKSYLPREMACSEEERACLQYGRVLASDGNCYKALEWTGKCEPGQTFHVDLREATREGGRLQGTCRSLCRGHATPLAATGQCVDYTTMAKICRWEWGMYHSQDVFGQTVCQCRRTDGSTPEPPATPPPAAATPGLCTVPDFTKPTNTPNYDATLTLGFRAACSAEEWACLRTGRLLADGACHALRTRGPCAAGEQLLLDKRALARAQLRSFCAALPCPEGSVRLPADGRCLTHQQVVKLLCPSFKVALDEFGGWKCDHSGYWPGNLTSIIRNAEDGTCLLPDKYGYHGPRPFGQPIAEPIYSFASGSRAK